MSGLQLFDALDAATEAALRASIHRFGVLVPVVTDQHGRILDGHHRSRIADDLDVLYRTDVVHVADDAEAEAIARTLNTERRHLTPEQIRVRREAVVDLKLAGHTNVAIAKALKMDEKQVRRDLSVSDVSETELPATVVRSDGKPYPAARPAPEADPEPEHEPEQHPAEVAIFKIRDDLRAKAAPVDRVDKACRQISDAALGIRGIEVAAILDGLTLETRPSAGQYVRDLKFSADQARRTGDALDALAAGIESTPLRRVK